MVAESQTVAAAAAMGTEGKGAAAERRGGGGGGSDDGNGGDDEGGPDPGKYGEMVGITRCFRKDLGKLGNAALNDGYIQPMRSWRGGFTRPRGVTSS
jgi:hypothetical protein